MIRKKRLIFENVTHGYIKTHERKTDLEPFFLLRQFSEVTCPITIPTDMSNVKINGIFSVGNHT